MSALLGSSENQPVIKAGALGPRKQKPRTLSGHALSRGINEELAYEFYSSFFSHYLPKRFIEHYVYFNGLDYRMTEQEMEDCNPDIWLYRERYKEGSGNNGERGKAFVEAVSVNLEEELMRGVFAPAPVQNYVLRPAIEVRQVKLRDFECAAGAYTNGTLGNFTAKLRNLSLTVGRSAGGRLEHWRLDGEMSFFDIWDFDPKPFFESGRPLPAELKVRAAFATLPGTSFHVTSPYVKFWTGTGATRVHWSANGKEVPEPKRVGDSAINTVLDYAPDAVNPAGAAFALFLDLMPTQ